MARKKRVDVNAEAEGFGGGAFADLLKAQGLVAQDAAPTPEAAPEEAPREAEICALRFTLDRKKRRGKVVTLVEGVSGDRRALIKEIKRALGCGVSEDGERLVVQGDQREALEAFFARRAD